MKSKSRPIWNRLILTVLAVALIITSCPVLEVKAESDTWDFTYSGSVVEWVCPATGQYKLEVWGAQGGGDIEGDGSYSNYYRGGYGGYSSGEITLTAGDKLYICVGQAGMCVYYDNYSGWESYNGGGSSVETPTSSSPNKRNGGTGGGCTSICKTTNRGVLHNYKDNLDEIIIVAGGGGGAMTSYGGAKGGAGGGTEGQSGFSVTDNSYSASAGAEGGASSSRYYEIGKAKPGTCGGGGYYGYTSNTHLGYSGGGGSGYLSSELTNTSTQTGVWGRDESLTWDERYNTYYVSEVGVFSGLNGKAKITSLHTHDFSEQNTGDTYKKSDATCTDKAVYYYSCTCGEKGTTTFEYGNALGHAYPTDYSYATDNSIANGLKYKNCTRCSTRLESYYLQRIRVRYQNADGTYGSYSNVVNTYYASGSSISWSRAADATYKVASTSWTSIEQAKSVDITVYRNTASFDLNGWLDGVLYGSLGSYGTADVYINGSIVANDVADYNNTSLLYGASYEIKDIKANTGYTYNGVHQGSLSGTVGTGTAVVLDFTINYYNLTLSTGTGISEVTGAGSKKYGSSVTIDATVKPGYTWKNWTGTYTKADKNTTFTMTANDVALTANASANIYYIDYLKGLTDCNSSLQPASTACTYDQNVTFSTKGSLVGRSYNITFNSNIPTTVTTGNTYTITSNSINGNLDSAGIWSINSSNYNMGSTTTTPPNFTSVANGRVNATAQWKSKTISNLYTPTMTGYKFIGWYDQPTGGTKITVVLVEPATTAYSITLYAHWEPITYTVTFHGNDNWNTAQGSYTQTLTFDKVETLTANKFNRDASNNKIYNGEILTEGYSFEGWSHDNAERGAELYSEDAFGKSVNVHLTDGATACWNFTTQPNGNVNLYAIWKKPLSLSFDYTGGYYKTGVVAQLSYDLYNAEYEHTFNISQLYGTVIENGLNSNITKADSEGTNYRFLGFTVDASQTNEPDNNLVVYSNSRLQNYTIHDDKALYATWEPVLNVSIKLNRKLGILQTSNSAYDLKAVSDTADISMECKAGEQGSYTIISPTAEKITVEFDERITNLYEDSSKIYYDTLNPVDSEILVAGQKHGLNRLIYVTDKITARTFCVPAYLGSKYCPTESQDTHYTIIFTVTQDSYYWQNIKGKPAESIEVTGHIYLETADDDSSSVESVLDELRTKLKIRLQ